MKVYNLAMAKHHGESTKTRQVEQLPQAIIDELQVQTRSQAIGVTRKEYDSKNSKERKHNLAILCEQRKQYLEHQSKREVIRRGLQLLKPALMFSKRV